MCKLGLALRDQWRVPGMDVHFPVVLVLVHNVEHELLDVVVIDVEIELL